jgi:hypothetical protein
VVVAEGEVAEQVVPAVFTQMSLPDVDCHVSDVVLKGEVELVRFPFRS